MPGSDKIVIISPPLSKKEDWADALKTLSPEMEVQIYPDDTDRENTAFLWVWNAPPEIYGEYPNLKVIASITAGVDHLFKARDLPKDVIVTKTNDPGQKRDMAVFVLALVLRRLRRFGVYAEQKRVKHWQRPPYQKPEETSIGLMGLGNIGTEIAALLVANGFKLTSWSRTEKDQPGVKSFFGEDQKEAFLATAEVLVSILPLTPATEGILNAGLFGKLPCGAYLINIGRGKLLVERDLENALETGQLSGAALDVFREEPLPKTHPFWENDRIFITPHIANSIVRESVARNVLENYRRMKNGEKLIDEVAVEKGY